MKFAAHVCVDVYIGQIGKPTLTNLDARKFEMVNVCHDAFKLGSMWVGPPKQIGITVVGDSDVFASLGQSTIK